jgi:hypothetical protein
VTLSCPPDPTANQAILGHNAKLELVRKEALLFKERFEATDRLKTKLEEELLMTKQQLSSEGKSMQEKLHDVVDKLKTNKDKTEQAEEKQRQMEQDLEDRKESLNEADLKVVRMEHELKNKDGEVQELYNKKK